MNHFYLMFLKHLMNPMNQKKLKFHLYFADVGSDEDKRDYEVSYARIRGLGFEVAVDIDRGLDELIGGLRHVRIHNPYSNV